MHGFADRSLTTRAFDRERPRLDSNQRPPASETGALPLRYEGMVRAERFELPKREGNWVTASHTSPSVARPRGDRAELNRHDWSHNPALYR